MNIEKAVDSAELGGRPNVQSEMNRRVPLIPVLVLGVILLGIIVLLLSRQWSARMAGEPVGRSASSSSDATIGRCASQRTYDRIKLELFRRAAQVRGSDQSAFDRLAAYSSVRVEQPILVSQDKELGTLRCSGELSLDLPPGVTAVGQRRTLTTEIDYVLQPAADGSGDVVMLEGADAIVAPLATVSQTRSAVASSQTQPPAETPSAEEPRGTQGGSSTQEPTTITREPPTENRGSGTTQTALTARPSFNCRYAKTSSELAVCSDDRLAALDRQMSAQYLEAISRSNPRQRQILSRTRDEFLRYRDTCTSNACIAQAYQGRMREIRDISGR